MRNGEVKWYCDRRGYGFITEDDGSGETFFHYSSLCDTSRIPAKGDSVEYNYSYDYKRRLKAVNVRRLDRNAASRHHSLTRGDTRVQGRSSAHSGYREHGGGSRHVSRERYHPNSIHGIRVQRRSSAHSGYREHGGGSRHVSRERYHPNSIHGIRVQRQFSAHSGYREHGGGSKHVSRERYHLNSMNGRSSHDERVSPRLRSRSPMRFQQRANIETCVPQPLMPHHYESRFKEVEKIGNGSYGSVYLCTDKNTGLTYAVKKIPFNLPDYNKIQREAVLMRTLEHPNVVRYHEHWFEEWFEESVDDDSSSSSTISVSTDSSGDDEEEVGIDSESCSSGKGSDSMSSGGSSGKVDRVVSGSEPAMLTHTMYIVMEFCPGTLKKKIKEGLNKETALCYGRQINDALCHIHDHNIIHRDICTDNILLDSAGIIKVADFGLAISCGEEMAAILSSQVGQDRYRAPEMNDENGLIDSKVDVFSAGLVVLEMLSKLKGPIHRKKTFRAVQRGQVDWSTHSLRFHVEPMLQFDPTMRMTAEEVAIQRILYPKAGAA